MLGVRLWELLVLGGWLLGLWLCLRHTRRGFMLGVFMGCSLTFGYDWFFADARLWNLHFHPDTIWLYHWFGQPQALWSPLSYGAFFGIAGFLALRYRKVLDRRLGLWQYPIAMPLIFLANVVVEGGAIALWQTNVYQLPPEYLFGNIPIRHLLTTGLMFAVALFCARQALDLIERAGWSDFNADPAGAANAEPRMRWKVLLLGVVVPQAGFYAALVAAMMLYSAYPIAQP